MVKIINWQERDIWTETRWIQYTSNVSRQSQRGCGVAIVFNSDLKVEQISNEIQFTHFEKLECMVSGENKKIRLCVLYRPPPSTTNNFRNSVFFDEWSDFLDQIAVTPDELIITGDLNFHLDDTKDGDARKFIQSLEDHGLIQHVTGPTHKHGHTLDIWLRERIVQSCLDNLSHMIQIFSTKKGFQHVII